MGLSTSRRGFLKALGLGTLAAVSGAPFRRGVRQAEAAQPAVPRRFVGLKYCQGTRWASWWPAHDGPDVPLGTLSYLLEPFERVKQHLLVLKGLKLAASRTPSGSHEAGMCTFLTGSEMYPFRTGGSISLDQYLADQLGQDTRFPSLVTGVLPRLGTISYRGKAQPVMADPNPLSVYRRMFSGIVDELGHALPEQEVERLWRTRKSILDEDAAQLVAIERTLSGTDRDRLQVHLDAIRRIERGFQMTAACPRTEPPPVLDPLDHANIPLVSRLHLDLIVLALSCRLTQVATHIWASGGSHLTFAWLGAGDLNQHGLSHLGNNDVEGTARYLKALRWLSEEMAYLCERMDQVMEADGRSLLYHSVVLVGTDNGQGNNHSISDVPFLVAGQAGGALRTGRFIEYPAGTAHNGLLISIANAMGAPVTTFGDPAYCSGPLPGLT